MYRFAICDDDVDFCLSFSGELRNILTEKRIDFTADIFHDTGTLLNALETGGGYDLLFLDILLNGKNGLDFARTLRADGRRPDIVFISSHEGYAVDSFDVEPLYYILKPVSPAKLGAALERFLRKHASGTIRFHTSGGYLNLRIADIIYIEINGHNVTVHRTDGVCETFRATLGEVEALLPPGAFLKPHRSFLVNFEHICGFSRSGIRVTFGTLIPVSKRLYNQALLEFMRYLGKDEADL